MNLQQYLSMRRQAFKNDGRDISLDYGAYDLLLWDTTKSTDWQRKLFGGMGKTVNIRAGLSGGTRIIPFVCQQAITRNTDILTVSGADQRGSFSIISIISLPTENSPLASPAPMISHR